MLSVPCDLVARPGFEGRDNRKDQGPGSFGCRALFFLNTQAVRPHQWTDERSLALHAAVAAKLEAQLELLDVARENLHRWLGTRPAAALRERQSILDVYESRRT